MERPISLRVVTTDGWEPDQEYAKFPNHDLHDVPLVVLEAGRAYMRLAASLGDVADDDAQPLADAVIAAALPLMREWMQTMRCAPGCSAESAVVRGS